MIAIEHSVVIDRPVEAVFSFVTDLDNAPVWQAWAEEAHVTSEGPLGAGAEYVYTTRFLGRRIESKGKITVFDRNSRYGWKVTSGPMPSEADYTFESGDGGTRITGRGTAEAAGVFKLAEPVLGRMLKRQVVADVDNLKDLLEAGKEDGV